MPKKFGSRSEVYDEHAEMTRGGLRKADLLVSRTGRIVSKKKSEMARTAYEKYGFNKRVAEKTAEEPKKKKRRRRKNKDINEENADLVG
jgi:hypothetical protein